MTAVRTTRDRRPADHRLAPPGPGRPRALPGGAVDPSGPRTAARDALRVAVVVVALSLTAAVLGALAPPPASAAFAAPSWLCRPDTSDVCDEPLDTTVVEAGRVNRVVPGGPAPDAPVDCFYVYPTTSNDLGPAASGNADPEIVGMGRLQAQRFAQECRVYAPLYRQLTVPALFLGSSTTEVRERAYADVLAAWRAYLARDNRGRGVVLIGHSQGTGVLRRLIREEIDPDPAARARLVSALLLGGNVLVRKGADRGGDFRDVPLCRADGQFGCVIAWSAFGQDPPPAARFGRPPVGVDRLTGQAAPTDVEVACTNPASLADNRESELESLYPTTPFPAGLLGVGAIAAGLPAGAASTPWVRTADRYTGRCERVKGAHVLYVRQRPGARTIIPVPDDGWGLHLVDVNIALGDLQRVVAAQSAAWVAARDAGPAATPAAVRPRVALAVSHRTTRGADRRRCVASTVVVRVAGADRRRARRVDFRLRARTVLRDRRAPFVFRVGRARLRAGANRIDALVTLQDGRRRRVATTVRGCATG